MEWKNVLFVTAFCILQIKVFLGCHVKIARINFMFHASENGSKLVTRVIVLYASLISFDFNKFISF